MPQSVSEPRPSGKTLRSTWEDREGEPLAGPRAGGVQAPGGLCLPPLLAALLFQSLGPRDWGCNHGCTVASLIPVCRFIPEELSTLHRLDSPGASGMPGLGQLQLEPHESCRLACADSRLLWAPCSTGRPWQVAASPHGATSSLSRKCLHPKRLICIWKPLIRLHVWLRHHLRSLPAALLEGAAAALGKGQSHPCDLLSEPQTTPFPQRLPSCLGPAAAPSTGRKQGAQPCTNCSPPGVPWVAGGRTGGLQVPPALAAPRYCRGPASPARRPSPGAFSCCKSGRRTCQLQHSQQQPLKSDRQPIKSVTQGLAPPTKPKEWGRFQQGCSRAGGCREIRNHLSAGARDGTLRS